MRFMPFIRPRTWIIPAVLLLLLVGVACGSASEEPIPAPPAGSQDAAPAAGQPAAPAAAATPAAAVAMAPTTAPAAPGARSVSPTPTTAPEQARVVPETAAVDDAP